MPSSPVIPTPSPVGDAAALSPADYQAIAEATLAAIEGAVDAWLDDDTVDIDVHRTGGMLELSFPNGSKVIVNTQPPLQELWLAARCGGYHYRWREDAWRDTRDGGEFYARLSACAAAQAGLPLHIQAPNRPSRPASSAP